MCEEGMCEVRRVCEEGMSYEKRMRVCEVRRV